MIATTFFVWKSEGRIKTEAEHSILKPIFKPPSSRTFSILRISSSGIQPKSVFFKTSRCKILFLFSIELCREYSIYSSHL